MDLECAPMAAICLSRPRKARPTFSASRTDLISCEPDSIPVTPRNLTFRVALSTSLGQTARFVPAAEPPIEARAGRGGEDGASHHQEIGVVEPGQYVVDGLELEDLDVEPHAAGPEPDLEREQHGPERGDLQGGQLG